MSKNIEKKGSCKYDMKINEEGQMPVIEAGNLQEMMQSCTKKVCYQEISELIESIALEQTALSHILNAEGEKIQKVIAMEPSAAELVMLNDSVKDMVDTITRVEMLLQTKLENVEHEICPRCDLEEM